MAQTTRHNPASVHAPSSGYSMGLELGQHRRLLFVSGQVPEKPDGSVPEGFEAQCEQAWRNVIEVLAAAGCLDVKMKSAELVRKPHLQWVSVFRYLRCGKQDRER